MLSSVSKKTELQRALTTPIPEERHPRRSQIPEERHPRRSQIPEERHPRRSIFKNQSFNVAFFLG